MNVGVLRLTNGFAGFFEDELRLLLGAGRLQELHCFGEFTRSERMLSGRPHGCVLVAALQLGQVMSLSRSEKP